MKKLFLIIFVIVFSFIGCSHNKSSDDYLNEKTEQAMDEANRQIGMPNIVNFQEKKLAKLIFELRDREDFVTYAYIVNLNGDLIFIGECIGYGLPYSVQFTNPQKLDYSVTRGGTAYGAAIPQADPNGLFMPEGLSATWLMLIDPETKEPRPVYVEPEIIVSPFKLH